MHMQILGMDTTTCCDRLHSWKANANVMCGCSWNCTHCWWLPSTLCPFWQPFLVSASTVFEVLGWVTSEIPSHIFVKKIAYEFFDECLLTCSLVQVFFPAHFLHLCAGSQCTRSRNKHNIAMSCSDGSKVAGVTLKVTLRLSSACTRMNLSAINIARLHWICIALVLENHYCHQKQKEKNPEISCVT